MDRVSRPFFYLISALFVLTVLMPLSRIGMGIDGVTYAAIAHNLATGIGTLWEPSYTATIFPKFYEHPPLALGLQSLFFRMLGNSYFVEKLYCLLMTILNIYLIYWLWHCSFPKMRKDFLWLPLALWILMGLNGNTYTNNYLEGTATIFSTLAAALLIKQYFSDKNRFLTTFFLASLATVVSFMSNGPTGLFVLALPLIFAFSHRKITYVKALTQTFTLIAIMVALFALLFFIIPEAWLNIKTYFQTQVLPSTMGDRSIELPGLKRLNVLKIIFMAISSCLSVIVLGAIIQKRKVGKVTLFSSPERKKDFIFYFLLALAASLPVIVSHRQSSHYILQSCPFYLLAFGQIICPWVTQVVPKIKIHTTAFKVFYFFSIGFLFTSVIVYFVLFGTVQSHQDIIHDMPIIL